MTEKVPPGGAAIMPMVDLPAGIEETIDRAATGDPFSWGELYGIAGAVIGAGHALPEPLRQVIAERLSSLGASLTRRPLGDVRARTLEAAVPVTRPRLVGAKQKTVTRLAAEAAVDMLEANGSHGRRKAVESMVVEATGVPLTSLQAEINAVRKERRSKR